MKTLKELGTANRGDPCVEFPGEWILYYPSKNGKEEEKFPTFDLAFSRAKNVLNRYEDEKREYDVRDFSICWRCSDNDPRIGQVWFTGFYCHGRFNIFGDYRSP